MGSRVVILALLASWSYSAVEHTQTSRQRAVSVAGRSKLMICDEIPPQTRCEIPRFSARRSALTVLAPFGAGREPQPRVLRRL